MSVNKSDEEVIILRADCLKKAGHWNDSDTDPDDKYGLYMNQANIYYRELQERGVFCKSCGASKIQRHKKHCNK
jgi:hypothetical protein